MLRISIVLGGTARDRRDGPVDDDGLLRAHPDEPFHGCERHELHEPRDLREHRVLDGDLPFERRSVGTEVGGALEPGAPAAHPVVAVASQHLAQIG
jgi:hypothetical protein